MNTRNAKPVKILLVDDNPGDVRLTQEALGDAGLKRIPVVYILKICAWHPERRFCVVEGCESA